MLNRMVYGQLHLQHGPLCKGECTEGDWCSARRLWGSSVRCMMWWKWVNVFLYHIRSLATLHAGYFLWIIYYLGKGILIKHNITFFFSITVFVHDLLTCLCVLAHMVIRAASGNTLIWQDLPHLQNSDSHHCNRPWHHLCFKTKPGFRITAIPEYKSMDHHKLPEGLWGRWIFSRITT